MTPAEIALVQGSFRQVAPIKAQAAALSYGRLFAIGPSAAPLFAGTDMADQGAKLMATLGMVVGGLGIRRPWCPPRKPWPASMSAGA